MSFLKRIREIAGGRSQSGPQKIRKKTVQQKSGTVEQATAQERMPEPEPTTESGGTGGTPELSPAGERLDRLKTLTPREWEVYEHLIRARKMREIARLLGVTYATVNFHCQGLYKKLCINTRAQLFMQYAVLDAADVKKAREESM
jgi:DNA-binding NarL/FixJ family response regulator